MSGITLHYLEDFPALVFQQVRATSGPTFSIINRVQQNEQLPTYAEILQSGPSRHGFIASCSGMIVLAITWALLAYIAG